MGTLSRLNQKEKKKTENMKRPFTSNEIESVIKKHPNSSGLLLQRRSLKNI